MLAKRYVRLLVAMPLLGGCTAADEGPDGNQESGPQGLRFSEVSAAAGLAGFRHVNGAAGDRLLPETLSGAVAVIDANGDGWNDVLLVGGATWSATNDVPAVRLFVNQRDGSFSDVTDAYGLSHVRGYGMGLAVADFDNDGDEDFYLTTIYRNQLFRNDSRDGTRHFTEVADSLGVAGDSTWNSSAVFFDADRDGWLDLFVASYVAWTPQSDLPCLSGARKSYCTPEIYKGLPPRFYRNLGGTRFEDQSDAAGFSDGRGKTLGVAVVDFDEDGWLDLVLANDTEPDQLYRNQGDGTFSDIGIRSGMAYDELGRPRAGMGVDAGVVDPTGRTTLFVGNFSNEMIGVYRYEGDLVFSDRAAVSRIGGVSRRSLAFALFLLDADLDGDLDLFVSNGHIIPEVDLSDDDISFAQLPHLFINDGKGDFEDVAARAGAGLTIRMVGRGAAYLDYDRDGDLDLLVVENGGPVRLFRNEIRSAAGGPSFLRVETRPRAGSGPAVGTQIEAYVEGTRIRRTVNSASGYLSQSEVPIVVGLGNHTVVDSLVVTWTSGSSTVLTEIPTNQHIVVRDAP